MPSVSYRERLTRREIIELFNDGLYKVDIETGVVSSRNGKPLYTFTNKQSNHKWVRLFRNPKYRCVAVAHIVWMVATQCVVPDGWQVHHRDLDSSNDSFNNLICVHPKDHNKLHNYDLLVEAPF